MGDDDFPISRCAAIWLIDANTDWTAQPSGQWNALASLT
jgi:hypothetical protein